MQTPRAYLLVAERPDGAFGAAESRSSIRSPRRCHHVDSTHALASTRSHQLAVLQQTIAGLTKHAQDLPSLVIAGTTYQSADLLSVLQARLAAQSSEAT